MAAVAALPAGSLAEAPVTKAPPTLKGELATGGSVAFDLKRTDAGERKVLHWSWRNLRVKCADADHKVDGIFNPPWPPVTQRSFQQRAELNEPDRKGYAEVIGRFSRTWRKAKGTFRVSGDTSQFDDCESQAVDWTAKRV